MLNFSLELSYFRGSWIDTQVDCARIHYFGCFFSLVHQRFSIGFRLLHFWGDLLAYDISFKLLVRSTFIFCFRANSHIPIFFVLSFGLHIVQEFVHRLTNFEICLQEPAIRNYSFALSQWQLWRHPSIFDRTELFSLDQQ